MTSAMGAGGGYIRVRGIDGSNLYFAFSIRIVDLDPKSAKVYTKNSNTLIHKET